MANILLVEDSIDCRQLVAIILKQITNFLVFQI